MNTPIDNEALTKVGSDATATEGHNALGNRPPREAVEKT
jgi:hypothetical protein